MTEFVSMRKVYDRLDDEIRTIVNSLPIIHDYIFSRRQVAPVDHNRATLLSPVKHPLVRENLGNGKRKLYVRP